MKTTIASITTAVLMTLSLASFATTNYNPLRSKEAKEILISYAEATTIGTTELNKFLFADDFQYENTANNLKTDKKTYLKFLKQNKGLVYNCETENEILDQTGNTAIAKTTYKFEDFTRIDHVTLVQSKDGWKISKVVTSYL